MYRKALGVVLALIAGKSLAVDVDKPAPGWVTIGATVNGTVYEAKISTWKITSNAKGKKVASVSGQVKDKQSSNIEFYTWQVTLDDCKAEAGTLYTLTLAGKYVREASFMFDGGSVASTVAEEICAITKTGS